MIGDATQFVTNGDGQKVAVVLPLAEYEELIEDLQDLAVIAERRDEPNLPWEDVKRRLEIEAIEEILQEVAEVAERKVQ